MSTRVADGRPGAGAIAFARATLAVLEKHSLAALLVYSGWVFFKVLAVSDWTLPTALAVLRLTPVSAIVLGTLLSALPMVALISFACVLYVLLSGYWREDAAQDTRPRGPARALRRWLHRRARVVWLLAGLGAVALALAPYALVVLALLGAVLFGIVPNVVRGARRRRKNSGRSGEIAAQWSTNGTGPPLRVDNSVNRIAHEHLRAFARDRLTATLCLALALAIFSVGFAQIVGSMWLPHEDLYSGEGGHVATGYVVGEENNTVYVLESGDREFLILQSGSIGRRQVCSVRYKFLFVRREYTYRTDTLLGRIGRANTPPLCTDP
jgi:hypothetical protein